jgi:hypothetical protein
MTNSSFKPRVGDYVRLRQDGYQWTEDDIPIPYGKIFLIVKTHVDGDPNVFKIYGHTNDYFAWAWERVADSDVTELEKIIYGL